MEAAQYSTVSVVTNRHATEQAAVDAALAVLTARLEKYLSVNTHESLFTTETKPRFSAISGYSAAAVATLVLRKPKAAS